MLRNSVPELRNFKKILLIPVWMHKKKLSCKQILNSLSYPLKLLFYDRRRLWRFWMVSSKFLMMTDEKWLNICKNHEGSVKKEVRKIFTYTFEIFLVVMWIFERVICTSVFIEKKWYVYDRHLSGKMCYSALIIILLYCTKIIFWILGWRTIAFGLYAPHFFVFFADFGIYMHVLLRYLFKIWKVFYTAFLKSRNRKY